MLKHPELPEYKIYVLVPYCEKPRSTLSSYTQAVVDYYNQKKEQGTLVEETDNSIWSPEYDYPSYREQLDQWLHGICRKWVWQPVAPKTMHAVVDSIVAERKKCKCMVMNLCEGGDVDGYPGPALICLLEANGIPYSGEGTKFFEITTSKPLAKQCLCDNHISTAPFVVIRDDNPRECVREAAQRIGFPFIVKPSVSSGSHGIESKSVCYDEESALQQIERLAKAEELGGAGVFVEKFIVGREFTVLVAGHPSRRAEDFVVYPAVERAFNKAVPLTDRFLTFDDYWSLDNSKLPPGEKFYYYKHPEEESIQRALQETARKAFACLGGTSYARFDIRIEADTTGAPVVDPSSLAPQVYILEANALCGLSTDGETSVSWIMHLSGSKMTDFVAHILSLGLYSSVHGRDCKWRDCRCARE